VRGAVALPFDGDEPPISEGNDLALPGTPEVQAALAQGAGVFLGPVEGEARSRERSLLGECSGVLLFLAKELADG
jgi:hypothetical protein